MTAAILALSPAVQAHALPSPNCTSGTTWNAKGVTLTESKLGDHAL